MVLGHVLRGSQTCKKPITTYINLLKHINTNFFLKGSCRLIYGFILFIRVYTGSPKVKVPGCLPVTSIRSSIQKTLGNHTNRQYIKTYDINQKD